MNNFPLNPSHGDIYEYKTGLLYQYDAGANSWMPVISNSAILDLATPINDGAMSAVDLQKLNRLVLPFPESTLIGNDCEFPFSRGTIDLTSGDDFIGVEGNVRIRNIDDLGDNIETAERFHIHQHTFGFDFTLNLPNLVEQLIRLGQIKVEGPVGPKGRKGEKGDPGQDYIYSGPRGEKGDSGNAPECELTIEIEPISANPRYGLDKAFVDARVIDHPTDAEKYILEFDRQSIGNDNRAATRLNIEGFGTYWVVAVTGTGGGRQRPYFLDVEPIISAIRDKFMEQVQLLKDGYESISKHWVQTMSDLFDEQKAALCCALENCISKTKSIEVRRHMESTAASALPNAKIKVDIFPASGLPAEDSPVKVISNTRRTPGNDCYIAPQAQSQDEASPQKSEAKHSVLIDAAVNTASVKNAQRIVLPNGRYLAIITEMNIQIAKRYGSMIRVQHLENGVKKVVSFLDKGRYDNKYDAQEAYEGLTLAFNHDGGEVAMYLPSFVSSEMSGTANIDIIPIDPQPTTVSKQDTKIRTIGEQQDQQDFYCTMSSSHLNWYRAGWEQGKCCGLVVRVAGQQYIIFKRGLGDDDACGGGESQTTLCVDQAKKKFKEHPAFAWPTINGEDFAPIPEGDITFKYDEELNATVHEKMGLKEYNKAVGDPNSYRHLAYQLSLILFPTSSNG